MQSGSSSKPGVDNLEINLQNISNYPSTEKQVSNDKKQNENPKEEPLELKKFSREWFWEIRGSTLTIVISISVAIFTDVFVYAIIVPVVPFAFVERLGLDPSDVQTGIAKALSLYSVGLIVGSFVFGYVADKMKRRQILMISGLSVLIGSTLILMFTRSMWLYLVGRLIQGVSAALVWTVGLAIIADSGDAENMAFLMSFPGIGNAMGVFLGPFIGGVSYEKSGYYAVYYICIGVLMLDVLLRLFMMEKTELIALRHGRALKLNELPEETISENDKMYRDRYLPFVDDSEEHHLKMVEMQKLYGDKIKLFGKIYNLPIILSIAKNPRIANAMFLGTALGWFTASIDATMTLHLEKIFGFNSFQSGLVFLALAAPSILEPVFGKISDIYGSKYTISGGFLFMVPFFILLRIPDHRSTSQIVMFIAFIIITNAIIIFEMAPCMAEMTKAMTKLEAKRPGIYGKAKGFGQAYGLFNVGYSIGTLCGPFQAGGFRNRFGWKWMVVSLAVIAAIVAIVSFFFAGDNFYFGRVKNAELEKSQESEVEA